MNVTDRSGRPPLSPQEGWISDGRQVLHFQPRRYDRWSQSLEVTLGELIPGEATPLLKRRKELTREHVTSKINLKTLLHMVLFKGAALCTD